MGGQMVVSVVVTMDGSNDGLPLRQVEPNNFGSHWLKNWWAPLYLKLVTLCLVMLTGVTLTPILLMPRHHPRGVLCCIIKTFTDSLVKGMAIV
jgi:hypothetical protein